MGDTIDLVALTTRKRENQVSFRLSDEELKALAQAVNGEATSVSNWVRLLIRARLQELGYLPVPKRPAGREQASLARGRNSGN